MKTILSFITLLFLCLVPARAVDIILEMTPPPPEYQVTKVFIYERQGAALVKIGERPNEPTNGKIEFSILGATTAVHEYCYSYVNGWGEGPKSPSLKTPPGEPPAPPAPGYRVVLQISQNMQTWKTVYDEPVPEQWDRAFVRALLSSP